MKTSTPETDAHQDKMNHHKFDEELAMTYTLARKLERERDDARLLLQEAHDTIKAEVESYASTAPEFLRATLEKLKPFTP